MHEKKAYWKADEYPKYVQLVGDTMIMNEPRGKGKTKKREKNKHRHSIENSPLYRRAFWEYYVVIVCVLYDVYHLYMAVNDIFYLIRRCIFRIDL